MRMRERKFSAHSGAMTFILLMGIVSLFSDMTHEGARSILGEYLNLTGASAATIGFVSGVGELLDRRAGKCCGHEVLPQVVRFEILRR